MKNLLILFALFLTLAACAKKDANVIKIGAAGPFTGDMYVAGQNMLNGVKLAVEEWNAKGGVLGKKIVIVEGDDQRDSDKAVVAAMELVKQDVLGVIGHLNSGSSLAAAGIYKDAGIPMISPRSSVPLLTELGFDNVFRVFGRSDQAARVAAGFAVYVLKAKKIAVIHDKSMYGSTLAHEFVAGVGNRARVLIYEGIDRGETDFSQVVSRVKKLNPDLVFFGGIYVEAGLLINQFRNAGLTAPFLGGDGIMGEGLIKIIGPIYMSTSLSRLVEPRFMDDIYATSRPDIKESPAAKGFYDNYRKKFGEPGRFSIYAYDATNVLLQAIANAGSTDKKMIIAALHAIDYVGAAEWIQFDAKGDIMTGTSYVVLKVEGGKFRQLLKALDQTPPPKPGRKIPPLVLVTFVVAFLASVLSGISGGGAGFILMPYLLFLGLTPQQALATSKLQNLGIAFGAITAFTGKGLVNKKLIWPLIIISTVCAFGASRLVPKIDALSFEKAIGILLIILIPSLFINKKAIQPGERSQTWRALGFIAYTAFALLTSLMGAGLGSMIVVVLMLLFGLRALEAQATKRVPQVVEAVITLVLLLLQGLVVFSHGVSGFVGSLAGCYIGTGISIKKGDKFVKVVLAITMFISGIILLLPAKHYVIH